MDSDLYDRAVPHTGCEACGRPVGTQKCGVCKRRVCERCYGEWNALACRECQEKARRRHAAATH